MKFLLSLILIAAGSSALANQADTTEKSIVKASQVRSEVGAEIRGDIDEEITDAKMRADSGSKSRFSGSLSLNYTGGSWEEPFSNSRPNVDGGDEEPVSLDGSVGIRYRINKNESFYVSTGISKVRPFDNQEGDDWEAKNPTLMYGNWFRVKDTQVRTSVMTYFYTEEYYRDLSALGTLAGTIGTMNQIGKTRFNFGLTNYLSYTFYDSETAKLGGRSVDIRSRQYDSFLDIRPTLQYKLNDRFNFYTSVGVLSFYHSREAADFDYKKADITQTVGAGISITRDVYLAPNVDFTPEDMRADNTSVNLSAVVNVL